MPYGLFEGSNKDHDLTELLIGQTWIAPSRRHRNASIVEWVIGWPALDEELNELGIGLALHELVGLQRCSERWFPFSVGAMTERTISAVEVLARTRTSVRTR